MEGRLLFNYTFLPPADNYYWELSRLLSPLLQEVEKTPEKENIQAYSGTRLQLMNGTLPYLPCKVCVCVCVCVCVFI